MKELDEIARLAPEELEEMANDTEIAVPADLEERLLGMSAAAEIIEADVLRRKGRRLAFTAAAASAAVLVTAGLYLTLSSKTPEDTFDDPYLAYAQVEKTLSYISSCMDRSMETVQNAGEATIGKSNLIIKEISKK